MGQPVSVRLLLLNIDVSGTSPCIGGRAVLVTEPGRHERRGRHEVSPDDVVHAEIYCIDCDELWDRRHEEVEECPYGPEYLEILRNRRGSSPRPGWQ